MGPERKALPEGQSGLGSEEGADCRPAGVWLGSRAGSQTGDGKTGEMGAASLARRSAHSARGRAESRVALNGCVVRGSFFLAALGLCLFDAAGGLCLGAEHRPDGHRAPWAVQLCPRAQDTEPPGLCSCVHGLSCPRACGVSVPQPGTEPCPLYWNADSFLIYIFLMESRFLTTGPPRKP